ncbi:MAG TPA: DUF711 family protein [Methylomirabilota bacterium]|nr:DUF711 family protein [Methylomirabilota bacterium]
MKIRAITVGLAPELTTLCKQIQEAGRFAMHAKEACEKSGVAVQTLRFTTPPFPLYLQDLRDEGIVAFAEEIEFYCREAGFEYCSLGPVIGREEDRERFFSLVPYIIAQTSSVFTSAVLDEEDIKRRRLASLQIAKVIRAIALATEGGFGNLRFAALVHCPAHIPFFPASYHEGEAAFAFALEAADVVRAVCRPEKSWDEIAENLAREFERQVLPLQRVGEALAPLGFVFRGVDLSPAPGPDPEASIVYALEGFGAGRFGEPGTLAVAGLMTSVLKTTRLQTCGYCGLMLPVLEDVGLAERNNQGLLRLTNLLAYSAVCGTGLDTIPLPGDASEHQLAALLSDVATLGGKLQKPLSARLLPIPGKRAGEMTEFDFPYFVNTKVMELL